MKRKRFSEEQIIEILKLHSAGAKPADLCRQHGISETTLYNWRSRYGGMEVSDAKRLRALEEENRKLKKLLAEAHLDMAALKSHGSPAVLEALAAGACYTTVATKTEMHMVSSFSGRNSSCSHVECF